MIEGVIIGKREGVHAKVHQMAELLGMAAKHEGLAVLDCPVTIRHSGFGIDEIDVTIPFLRDNLCQIRKAMQAVFIHAIRVWCLPGAGEIHVATKSDDDFLCAKRGGRAAQNKG